MRDDVDEPDRSAAFSKDLSIAVVDPSFVVVLVRLDGFDSHPRRGFALDESDRHFVRVLLLGVLKGCVALLVLIRSFSVEERLLLGHGGSRAKLDRATRHGSRRPRSDAGSPEEVAVGSILTG